MISVANQPDGPQIHTITSNTTVFNQEEIACVDELWKEYLDQGSKRSGYYFVVSKDGDNILGYACYGPRSLTSGTYDLYWIAVDPTARRGGIGRSLLVACEQAVQNLGGRLLVLETSGKPIYEPTRNFYLSTGYTLEATIKDFYDTGDDLVIFTKHL